jgi:bifunctional DNase/RNase
VPCIPVLTALLVIGCANPPPPAAPVTPAKPVVAEPSEPTGKPLGYVECTPERVIAVDSDQAALLLVDAPDNWALPVFIGGTEAASIVARLHRESPPRPLTHDLLDHVLSRVHATLVQVQVDELRKSGEGGTFIGSILLRLEGGRVIRLDSRPSDAVALAIGAHVPIYVKRTVLEEAGYHWDAVQKQLQQMQSGASG